MNKLKKIPRFETEAAERAFWQKADATEYVDFSTMERWIFPDLKLSSKPITLRLPESLIARAKIKAHKQDIPYQTLLKQWIFRGDALTQ